MKLSRTACYAIHAVVYMAGQDQGRIVIGHRAAEALGIPEGTVRSRLHHAMRGLRAALDADARPATREAAS